jgi:nucleoside-diphosphate-sugar epimerase
MNSLVIGGSGFIGRNIIKELNKKGHYTISYDIEDKNNESNEHIKGNIMDYDKLYNSMKNIDYVFNLAAVTSPPQFEDIDGNGYEVNIMGTYNILKSAVKNNIKKVILASSSAIYGNIEEETKEDMEIDTYPNLYPVTKFTNELTARSFSLMHHLDSVYLRYFNTYGNDENTKGPYSSVIYKFIENIKNNEKPVIYGDGTQSRDFIFIEDNARASVLAMEKGITGHAYNIGTGVTTNFNDIYNIVKEEMNSNIEPKYVKNPFKSYQMYTKANIERAKKEISFVPEYDIRKGVKKMLEDL